MALRAGLHGTVGQSTSAFIKGSTIFDSHHKNYLKRTPPLGGNRRRWTWSAWMKLTKLSDNGYIFAAREDNNNRLYIKYQGSDDTLYGYTGNSNSKQFQTTRVLRDPTGWYNIVWVWDSPNGTERDRQIVYINGERVTNSQGNAYTQNFQGAITDTIDHRIGNAIHMDELFDSYISEMHFIDSQALDATYFGYTNPLTGIWSPKKVIAPGPNKGQSWSDMCAGGTDSGYEHEMAFNGSDAKAAYPSPGSTITMTIPAGQLKWTTSFEMWVSRDINGGNITVNGGGNVTPSGSGFQIVDLSGQVAAGADITEITWARAGSGSIGLMVYYIMIDGVALLDSDWTNYGGEGCYLPFDGETYIGEDRSGRGNDWEPVNFGGSTLLDQATGALPILNTVGGGKAASSGVRIGTNDTPEAVTKSGCVLFDGSGDYLIGSSTSELLNDADWTVDGWFYLYKAPSSGGMIMLWDSGGGGNDPELGIWHNNSSAPGTIQLYQSLQSGTGWDGPSIEAGKWFYFKETVDGSSSTDSSAVYKLYLDGALCNTTTINLSSRSGSSTFGIGCRTNGSQLWKGAISNLRYREVVDNSLGVPDGPFASDGDTKLLCCQSSTDDTAATTIPTGSLSATGSPAPSTDEFAGRCSLAIPFNGHEKDVSDWVNSSSTAKALTGNGSNLSVAPQMNFWYGVSRKFGGAQSYYDVASSSDMAFGTGDFCMELWVRHYTGMGSLAVYITDTSGNSNGIFLAKNSSDQVYVYYTSTILTGSTVLQEDRWYHVAYVRDDGTSKIYIDGKEDASVSDTFNLTEQAYFIGDTNAPHVGSIYGYMQDVRCYKGTAKYYKEFTPASPYPDAKPDSPSGVSLGAQLASPVYGGSSWINGQSDQISVPYTADAFDWTSSSTDFCVESWNYHTALVSGGSGVWSQGTSGGFQAKLDVIQHSGYPGYCWNFELGGGARIRSDEPAVLNEWVHVACVMRSGTGYLYVDGKEQSITGAHGIGAANAFWIGRQVHDGGQYRWNGHISNLRVVTGSAVYTGNFEPPSAPLTNITNTKLLCLQDSRSVTAYEVSTGALTASGSGLKAEEYNPFDANQLDVKPTIYPTLNPLCCTQSGSTGPEEYSDGLLYIKGDGDTGYYDMCACATQLLPLEGKFMFEYECSNSAGTSSPGRRDAIGVYDTSKQQDYLTNIANSVGYQSWDGDAVTQESDVQTAGLPWDAGHFASCAIDCSTGKVWFATDGCWVGDPGKGTGQATTLTNNGHLVFCQSNIHNSSAGGYDSKGWLNFGQKPFKYTPPEGFGPLSSANKIAPLGNPKEYNVAVKYEGNNGVNHIECGFAPDLVICKAYTTGSCHWGWYDTVRGAGNTKGIYSSGTEAEGHWYEWQNLQEFTPDGFILGATSNTNVINESGVTNISYGFKAGGNKGTFNIDGTGYDTAAAAGLSAGDTTISGASVGTKQGFSIIKYTGPNDTSNHTVAHGLTQAPDLVIVKNLDDGTANWNVYHSFFDSGDYMTMTADATTTDGFNGVPSSTVINTQHGYSTDENDEFIAYCWHNVDGLQKVGKYISNNNSNGPMVYTGFRPSQVVLRIDGADSWHIFDNKRDPYNGIASRIFWNSVSAQGTSVFLDFLSDGFKFRTNDSGVNGSSGTTYYFIAWADQSPGPYGAQPNAY